MVDSSLDFGRLEVCVDRFIDPDQMAVAFQVADTIIQVSIAHKISDDCGWIRERMNLFTAETVSANNRNEQNELAK